MSGWRLDAFRRNPVLLWAHDDKGLTISSMLELLRICQELQT